MMHFFEMTEEELEPFRLLGLRIGNADGWPGKHAGWRTPRVVCDRHNPTEKSIDALLVEAKPDLVLYGDRDEYEWRKRGKQALRENPLCNRFGQNLYWGYDGFAESCGRTRSAGQRTLAQARKSALERRGRMMSA